MRKYYSILLFLLILLTGSKSGNPVKKDLITVNGDQPATLKTTNGCGSYAFFIANRGDSTLNIPSSIGYIPCDYPYYHFEIVDSFPGEQLLDFTYPSMINQTGLAAPEFRYFVGVTDTKMYLFENYLSDQCLPIIQKIDSLVTPTGYVASAMNDREQLLVINQQDSSEYLYTFYNLPALSIDSQLTLPLKPDRIAAYNSYQGNSYLICGTSAGIEKTILINASDQQIVYDITLPAEANNTKEIYGFNNTFYLLSSPGDSETFLIRVSTTDTTFSIFQLLNYSGINVSTILSDYVYGAFEFQPLSGPLNEQILLVDVNQNAITDTFMLNKRLIALHANIATGFGYGLYQLIMGTDEPSANDSVYMSSTVYLDDLYSLLAGAKPTWFAEDNRCYTNVNEIERNLSIQVYPNPATDEVQIVVKHLASGKTYRFDITDINGKVLWEKDIVAKEHYSVPLQEFPKGILILRVDAGTKIVTTSIIKQ